MMTYRTFSNERDALDFFRGDPVDGGTTGTTAVGTAAFVDGATTGAFADLEVGDQIYVSGADPVYTIVTKTDDDNLVLDQSFNAVRTADAHWRAFRGGTPLSAILLGPVPNPGKQGASWILYDERDFTVR